VPGSVENIVESLRWAGIEPDYGPLVLKSNDVDQGAPWFQSKRLDLYHKHSMELVESRKAYLCFCDETRLELLRRNAAKKQENITYDRRCLHLSPETVQKYLGENRPHVIRFKLDDRDVSYEDLTTGIHKNNPGKTEGDFIIIKSDKFPTYHFANVVDDHAMRITHVLRGQEWQSSTAKHISLYEAFGWKHPHFGHLPLIFNSDGSKVSKRQNDIDVLSFKARGYLRETLLAYLSSIGGGIKINILSEESRELLEKHASDFVNVLVENFDPALLNAKPIKLNQELLDNINRRFIQLKLSEGSERAKLVSRLKELVKERHPNVKDTYVSDRYLESVLTWSQDRIHLLNDLLDKSFSYLWSDMSDLNTDRLEFQLTSRLVEALGKYLDKVDAGLLQDEEKVKTGLKGVYKAVKIEKSKEAKSAKPLNHWEITRLILIGSMEGPPVAELFRILGKEAVVYRLQIAKDFCREKLESKNS
jgi:glutamyl-tRNA synthetase